MKRLKLQADALISKKAQAAVNQIRALMLEHGLTTADIDAPTNTTKGGAKTWTGVWREASREVGGYRGEKAGHQRALKRMTHCAQPIADAGALLYLITALVRSVFNHHGIGYPVVQRLVSWIEQHPQESCTACREAQQVA